MYINQCLQFQMQPEVVLFYSPNAYGTADAISYRYRRLRISDLKTGVTGRRFINLRCTLRSSVSNTR
jgi:hypothetical protein